MITHFRVLISFFLLVGKTTQKERLGIITLYCCRWNFGRNLTISNMHEGYLELGIFLSYERESESLIFAPYWETLWICLRLVFTSNHLGAW
ncbi:hypothetical protein BJ166DRAFT_521573 [Pestalotiopsis sp. NC0098]|nr:hypothetical protein BJ166DRAFT_521573 [Pestalotiopsis sp. NC0098]